MPRSVISFHNWVGRAELCSLRHGGLGCAGCHPQDSAELTTPSYLMPALVTGRQRTTLCCSEYLPERLHFRIKSVLSAWIWMYHNFSGPRYQYCVAFPKAPPCLVDWAWAWEDWLLESYFPIWWPYYLRDTNKKMKFQLPAKFVLVCLMLVGDLADASAQRSLLCQ